MTSTQLTPAPGTEASLPGGEAHEPRVRPGLVLDGRYRLVMPIGEGGLGVVYRAEHLKLGRWVAVKFLKDELVEHAQLRPRFEREARALAQLSHPNIVGIHDYGLLEDTPYLVMELLEGRTLRDLLDAGPLSEPQAFALMQQLLQGLAYAHARGVIHRDLKPSNMYLQRFATQPDLLKILDFGFAKFAADGGSTHLSRTSPVLGTPAYLPPEQALGDAVDARTDVYAAAIILYEMLTGSQPFRGSIPEILRQQLRDALPPFERVCRGIQPTPGLVALLERCTSKDRADRCADGAALLAAFQALPRPIVQHVQDTQADEPSASLGEVAEQDTVVVHEPTRAFDPPERWLRASSAAPVPAVRPAAHLVGAARRGVDWAMARLDRGLARLQAWAKRLERQLLALWHAARDARVPWYAKALALAVLAYAASPIDLIPDAVPVLGMLDDLVIVPAGIWVTIRCVPAAAWREARKIAARRQDQRLAESRWGAAWVVTTWLMLLGLLAWWLWPA